MAEGFVRQRKYEWQRRPREKRRPTCHPQRKHKADGLCEPCYKKRWLIQHPEHGPNVRKYPAECHPDRKARTAGLCGSCYMRFWWLHRLYGMTRDQFFELVHAQGDACAVCGEEPPPGKTLVVDHDHVTGRFRGLLCDNCNAGIGRLQDQPEIVERALLYLLTTEEETNGVRARQGDAGQRRVASGRRAGPGSCQLEEPALVSGAGPCARGGRGPRTGEGASGGHGREARPQQERPAQAARGVEDGGPSSCARVVGGGR